MGAADRLRSWGRRLGGNPWLAAGIVIGILLVCAWIGWAIHVWSDHGFRQGIGVLIVWPAIVAVLAFISLALVGGYRAIRGLSEGDGDAPGSGEGASDVGDSEEREGAESEAAAS